MSYTISFGHKDDLIKVVITGNYKIEEAKKLLLKARDYCKKYDCHKILIDARDVVLNIPINELYASPVYIRSAYKESTIPIHQLKRAIVVSKKTDNIRFLEDVNANQGQQVKIFLNFEEAREWLKK